MFDCDFEYKCPHCGEAFSGEHDLDREVIKQTLTCDECHNKFVLTSKASIEITCVVEKAQKE